MSYDNWYKGRSGHIDGLTSKGALYYITRGAPHPSVVADWLNVALLSGRERYCHRLGAELNSIFDFAYFGALSITALHAAVPTG